LASKCPKLSKNLYKRNLAMVQIFTYSCHLHPRLKVT
jgi:hypothetical protein